MHGETFSANRGLRAPFLYYQPNPKTMVGHNQGIYITVLGTQSAEMGLVTQTSIFSRV